MGAVVKYSAFISYSHKDRQWAIWLHRTLEKYRIPKRLQGHASPFGPLGKRLPPVFRDRDELASASDLAAAVRAGLEDSASLIVLCSPASAASKWVNEEIRTFIALGRRDRIRLVIVGGEPMSEDPALRCLPPAIFEGAEAEPLAADARKHQDGKAGAALKTLAGILEVPYDELRQREAARRQRQLAIIAAASTAGFAVTAGLAVVAVIARNEAERERNIAMQRTLTAERTLDFVKGMFRVSDPSVAQGNTITARQIVDRGARMLETGLEEEPAARADLGSTLAEVYGALGLDERGIGIAKRTFALGHQQPDVRVRQFAALAEGQFRMGRYDVALANFRKAETLLGDPLITPGLRSRILVGLGQSLSWTGDTAGADAKLSEALKLDRAAGKEGRVDVARDLEALGNNAFYAGDVKRAQPLFAEALRIRLEVEGKDSPGANDDRNALASIAHESGDLARAAAYLKDVMVADERLLGADHPDVAVSLNNYARILIEQRRFAEAGGLLRRAVTITKSTRDPSHDDFVLLYSNLALVEQNTGKASAARPNFERSLAIAAQHEHQMAGAIATDFANYECAAGNGAKGLSLLDKARPAVIETFGAESWRVAWWQNVRGFCQWRSGQRAPGLALMRRSAEALGGRWPAGTLIGDIVRKRPTG